MIDNTSVLIYASTITNRLRYTLDLMLCEFANISVNYTTEKDYFLKYPSAKINYSFDKIANELIFIKSHTLLFEKNIDKKNIDEIFKNSNDEDLFAKVFLCISRYEEYNLKATDFDSHARFSATKSFAQCYGFLQKPMVHIWVNKLFTQLENHYPNLIFKKPIYNFQPTFDIDIAWQFKNRSLLRSSIGFVKDAIKLRFFSVNERLKSLNNNYSDAYDTFGTIKSIHSGEVQPIYFWLLGDYGRFDKNVYWKTPALQNLIRETAKENTVGIHPSYKTNRNNKQLLKEIKRLETITGQKITQSRQHFLKLSLPDTYRKLIAAGISDDYSMGYSDNIGFRAGMATSFYWFDLERDEVTNLKIHPFQVMDVTLKNYLKLSPEAAINAVKKIAEEVRAVNGEFCTLWHNTSLSKTEEWNGWTKVYEEIVNSVTPLSFLVF